jgi:ABC-type proline/glycine betaine transport system substrate-binding protein
MFSKLQLTPQMLNQVLAQASAKKVGADVMAREFVKNNRQLVNSWMTSEAVANFNKNFK